MIGDVLVQLWELAQVAGLHDAQWDSLTVAGVEDVPFRSVGHLVIGRPAPRPERLILAAHAVSHRIREDQRLGGRVDLQMTVIGRNHERLTSLNLYQDDVFHSVVGWSRLLCPELLTRSPPNTPGVNTTIP